MATLVLVHGAMHGGWCWRDVRRRLAGLGHEVFTPTLTGQGDRRRALTPDTGLQTHVDDLLELLWFEDLTDVHLVLHSYAGVLAGQVAGGAGGRLASIVYAGAFVARSGECLFDVEPPATAARYRALAASSGEGWVVPASAAFLEQWGVRAADRRRVGERLTDFPLRCGTEPTIFDPAVLGGLRRVYLRHTSPALGNLALSEARARADGLELIEMATGHDMMLEDPVGMADHLARIAAGA